MSSVTTTTADTATYVATTTAVTTPLTSSVPAVTTTPPASTTTLPPSTAVVTADASTEYVAPTTTPAPDPTTIVTQITSVVTATPTYNNGNTGPAIVTTIYSTQPVVTYTPTASDVSTRSETSSSASSTRSALSAPGTGGSSSSKGLSSGATIAIAVIIPIAAVVGLIIFGLWFWRRRKAKKDAEELRKNEMAEYGFNPNDDPTLPVGAVYADGGSEGNDDSGYRGWGATTASNRKASTTLGSNSNAAALAGVNGTALSDGGSQGGYNVQPSPSAGGSDGMSQDPLVHGSPDAAMMGAAGSAALGGAAAAGGARNRNSQVSNGMHRGASNASSAYSGHARSDVSSDVPDVPARPYYQEEVPYNIYNDVQPSHGPYGDGTYGAENDQPIIRDVQARRNTRIERAPTFPQQGGIAQNF